MAALSAIEHLRNAEQLARAHNMFVLPKGDQFLLYRRTRTRPVFLGARADASAISSLVSRCATTSK